MDKTKRTKSYKVDLLKRLSSKRYSLQILQASFEESCADENWEAFGLTLRLVIEAQGDKRSFAKRAKVSRNHLYRLFDKDANPTLKTLLPVLTQLGLRLNLAPGEKRKAA